MDWHVTSACSLANATVVVNHASPLGKNSRPS